MSKPTWKQKLGHYSTWALAAIPAGAAWYVSNPAIHVFFPPQAALVAGAIVSLGGLIGKFIPQGKTDDQNI